MQRTYEIRDAIYGFIELDPWEREIISHPVFQRLRRIRQLSLTDMVYPGAMHNRFEHSLGVMHVATKMFDEIVKRRSDFLKSELSYDDAGLKRDRILLRLSCLLHDIGHAPFSHASEKLMAKDPNTGKHYAHENYSAAAVEYLMRDVIENHPLNQNYRIKAQDIADFLNNRARLERSLLWRDLLSSQLDADRADYLLRDSHHTGVAYGKYDLNRLLVTLTVAIDPDTHSPVVAVEDGGENSAEALILARYMMFTQVYFHRTRRAYDIHVANTIKCLLKEHQNDVDVFPPPTKESIVDYLKWDDWRVMGMLHAGQGGEHGKILFERKHHRCVFQTRLTLEDKDQSHAIISHAKKVTEELSHLGCVEDEAKSSWYKLDSTDIPILVQPGESGEKLVSLSYRSNVVKGLKTVSQRRLYVPVEKVNEARAIVGRLKKLEEYPS